MSTCVEITVIAIGSHICERLRTNPLLQEMVRLLGQQLLKAMWCNLKDDGSL